VSGSAYIGAMACLAVICAGVALWQCFVNDLGDAIEYLDFDEV